MCHEYKILQDIPIYYINLNRSQDRRIILENNFKKYDITNYKRIEAVDGMDISYNYYQENYVFDKPNITIYEIACLFSHLKAIEEAYNDKQEYALILEDDVSFEYLQYKHTPLCELMKLNDNWDIIQLSLICNRKEFLFLSTKTEIDFIKQFIPSAVAYLINKSGMKKVLEHMKSNNHIHVSENYIFKLTNTYLVQPYFTYYYRQDCKSLIRENTKSALATQTINKQLWDDYYFKKKY